jgi:hypothetical protein
MVCLQQWPHSFLLSVVTSPLPGGFLSYCSFNEARASLFFLAMTFRFINCSSNQRIDVQAADHDQALRAAAAIAGHFFLAFIKTF